MAKPVSLDYLKRVWAYDPLTGDFTWNAVPEVAKRFWGRIVGTVTWRGYRETRSRSGCIRLHRAAWAFVHGEWPIQYIDHVNNIRHDNRIENLREATHAQNLHNAPGRKIGASGHRGVHVTWTKSGVPRYSTKICLKGKVRYLGVFSTAGEAIHARNKAVVLHHGAFAVLTPVPDSL